MTMVRIEQHVWGMTPEGEAIILYTLRNDRGRRGAASAFDRAVAACVTEGVRFSKLSAKQKAYYIALRVCPRTSYFLP